MANAQVLGKMRSALKSLAVFFTPPVPPAESSPTGNWLASWLASPATPPRNPIKKVTGEVKQSTALLISFVWITAPRWVVSRCIAARDESYRVAANFKLRTKFLLSFGIVTTVLMCLTLLVVGREARHQIEQQMEEQSSRTILMFQVMQHQHEVSLGHKAELLAALAAMRDGDPTAVESASADPWQSEDCNLFLMTDAHGKVLALQTTQGDFPVADAERLLHQTLHRRATSAWWASGTQLYQVVVRPITSEAQHEKSLGTVVVGRVIDGGVASELRRISSSEVAFLSGNHIVISTFSPLEENELETQAGSVHGPQELKIDGQKYVASAVELAEGADAAHSVTLVMLKSYSDATAFLDRLNRWLIGLLLAAVFVGAMLVLFISDTFTRPLKRLVGGVHALEQGDFEYPLQPQGGDEVAQVTRAFGRMRITLRTDEAERLRLEDQLRRAQRMEAMGRLAGGVAHDFNNLLTVIKGHSDVLMGKLDPESDLAGSSQQIAKAADRAASLTRQLLIFSRRQATQPRVLDLNAVVSEMGKLLKRLIREDINFVFRPSESLGHLRADPCHLEQVVMNLVVNASDAMPAGGKLTIETYDLDVDEIMAQAHPPLKSGEYVVLAVTDTGCGMDENTKAHIFEPFFTTKTEGKGTGLGLATVYGAVKQSNGFVLVESELGKGARFEIYLPRVEEPIDLIFAPQTKLTLPTRTETVLIAEDEDSVREMASEFARSAGYQVLAARDGLEALAIAQAATRPVHILLTDVVIPHIRGPQLAAALRERMPHTKIVFMSGYLESQKEEGVLPTDIFLQKPFTRDGLIQKLEDALAKPSAKNGNKSRRKSAEPETANTVN